MLPIPKPNYPDEWRLLQDLQAINNIIIPPYRPQYTDLNVNNNHIFRSHTEKKGQCLHLYYRHWILHYGPTDSVLRAVILQTATATGQLTDEMWEAFKYMKHASTPMPALGLPNHRSCSIVISTKDALAHQHRSAEAWVSLLSCHVLQTWPDLITCCHRREKTECAVNDQTSCFQLRAVSLCLGSSFSKAVCSGNSMTKCFGIIFKAADEYQLLTAFFMFRVTEVAGAYPTSHQIRCLNKNKDNKKIKLKRDESKHHSIS